MLTLVAPTNMSPVNAYWVLRNFSNADDVDIFEENPIFRNSANSYLLQLYANEQADKLVDTPLKVYTHLRKRPYYVDGAGKQFYANFMQFPYITLTLTKDENRHWPSDAQAALELYNIITPSEKRFDQNDRLILPTTYLHNNIPQKELDEQRVIPSKNFIPQLS